MVEVFGRRLGPSYDTRRRFISKYNTSQAVVEV